MPNKQHRVILSTTDRHTLLERISAGTSPAQELTHARVLLKADEGPDGPAWTDGRIATALEISRPTIERIRRRWATAGLAAAIERAPSRRVYRRKLDGANEARLTTLACSTPPDDRAGWSLRLLADRMVALYDLDGVSYETIRRTLKKTNSNRG